MKKTLFLFSLSVVLGLSSCINQDSDYSVPTDERTVINEALFTTKAYDVPVQEGRISVVILDGDTIAVTDTPITVEIPKDIPVSATRTAASDRLQQFYIGYEDIPTFQPGSYITDGNHILLFEDSFKADYDYNDLVLYVKTKIYGNANVGREVEVSVRGLALGSTKTIGFGFTDLNGNDYLLTDNVRRDLFDGKGGMLNTDPAKQYEPGIIADGGADEKKDNYTIVRSPKGGSSIETAGGYLLFDAVTTTNKNEKDLWKCFSFYILVDNGVKLYVAAVDATLNNAHPYGLKLSKNESDLYYPAETVYMADAFPGFESWLANPSTNNDWYKNPVVENCYKISSSGMWRW